MHGNVGAVLGTWEHHLLLPGSHRSLRWVQQPLRPTTQKCDLTQNPQTLSYPLSVFDPSKSLGLPLMMLCVFH